MSPLSCLRRVGPSDVFCSVQDPALILELGLRHCFRLKLHVGSGNLDVTSVQGKVKQLGHLMYWFAICHDSELPLPVDFLPLPIGLLIGSLLVGSVGSRH